MDQNHWSYHSRHQFNVSGLSAAINYAYYVKAEDAAGNSTNSTTLNVTTPDTQAPTARPILLRLI
ncbi:MAG: fibronectin type III domain-containing protein [Saprospiraceae bacterium]|nr:fibronectin type III domain-containing protein [Saprospiraceae bacterium]